MSGRGNQTASWDLAARAADEVFLYKRALVWAPWMMLATLSAIEQLDPLDPLARMLQGQRGPVDLLTFVTLMISAIAGGRIAWLAQLKRADRRTVVFWALFSFATALLATEEIARGQWLLGLATPASLDAVGYQGEVPIYSIDVFQRGPEVMRVIFAAGGLIGVSLAARQRWLDIAPPVFLTSWFAAALLVAVPDLVKEFGSLGPRFDSFVEQTVEGVELLIGLTAVLYSTLMLQAIRRARAKTIGDKTAAVG